MRKKTKNEKTIPMSPWDRMQASLRIPEYVERLREKGGIDFKYDTGSGVIIKPHKRARKDIPLFFQSEVSMHDVVYPWLREGRYLTIEIDLMKEIGEIIDKIRSEIHYFQKYHVNKPKTRLKETFYSPWDVYDLHKGGKNFSQIARELSGRAGYASGNPKLMAVYKEVKRACDKACRMISQVEEEIIAIIHLSN